MKLLEVLKALVKWPRVPKKAPWSEPMCLGCGCTESAACEGGCGWQAIGDSGRWGICTACVDRNLCPIGATLVQLSVMEPGTSWKPVKTCLCPLCRAARKEKR